MASKENMNYRWMNFNTDLFVKCEGFFFYGYINLFKSELRNSDVTTQVQSDPIDLNI